MQLELRQYEPSQAFGPQNPTSGHAEAAPGPPGPARRDARPDQRPLLRRLHPLAAARLGQRHRGPARAAAGHAARHPRLEDEATRDASSRRRPIAHRRRATALPERVAECLTHLRVDRALGTGRAGYAALQRSRVTRCRGSLFALGTAVTIRSKSRPEPPSWTATVTGVESRPGVVRARRTSSVTVDDQRLPAGPRHRPCAPASTFSDVVNEMVAAARAELQRRARVRRHACPT